MSVNLLASFELGDMTVQYPHDPATGAVGLWMFPTALKDRLAQRRPYVTSFEVQIEHWDKTPAWRVDPLVHLHRRGDDATPRWGQGHTMRGSPSTAALKLEGQEVQRGEGETRIITRLASDRGYACEHHLVWPQGAPFVRVHTVVRNTSDKLLTLDMITSFSLGGITPFAADDAPERLRAHRFRTVWSEEGRLVTDAIEHLHLERFWADAGVSVERFGQVGSMPARRFFPAAMVEDTEAGVLWGAHLAWAGSWQMEFARSDDLLNLSGGLADREFGHWGKTLAAGAAFTTPEAVLSVAAGDVDDLADRLTAAQVAAVERQPKVEQDLPVCFNEWCTSWGRPTHDDMVRLADRLGGSGVKYLVIDAGWYLPEKGAWYNAQGDWRVNDQAFPQGLEATADAIRQRGMIPGLWFEMEVAGAGSVAFSERVEQMLHRDGVPMTVGGRRFWDLRRPDVLDHLSERVIGLLERCGFGYVKIDYNDTIGLGCDGAESLGEGLRQNVEGTYELFRRMRERLPELVIENCASGGHRLEPSMQAMAAMGSFSDAHETLEIPVVAANLHRLILPRQNLVWAVLRTSDDRRRLVYSLAATFLGRMCLSGKVADLTSEQWAVVEEALALYPKAAPIIKDGLSRRLGPPLGSYRHPKGWQAVLRTSRDGGQALAVIHSFADPLPEAVQMDLPEGHWRIAGSLHTGAAGPKADGASLTFPVDGPFAACVAWLQRG